MTLLLYISLQVFAVGGTEPAADPEVQEAGGGTFSPTREAQLLDGHHRGGHAGHDQQTEISRTNTQRHKHSNTHDQIFSFWHTNISFFSVKVLILEPTKIYQPSYVSINNEAEEKNVSIWHVSPAETVRMKRNNVTPGGGGKVGVQKHIIVCKARDVNKIY